MNHLRHWRLWIQHEVLEGSLKHPAELVEEGAVVGDDPGLCARETLLFLEDVVELLPGIVGVAAVLVLLHQTLLDAVPGSAQLLKV